MEFDRVLLESGKLVLSKAKSLYKLIAYRPESDKQSIFVLLHVQQCSGAVILTCLLHSVCSLMIYRITHGVFSTMLLRVREKDKALRLYFRQMETREFAK